MKANPGGHIDPSETFGRDGIITNLWRILERRSLILSAERRMGKTCIIKKMRAEAPQERLIVYRDLEGVRTPVEFAEIIFHDVEEYLSRSRRTAVRARQWLSHLAGAEIGSIIKFPDAVAPHWKSLLTKIIEDLIEHQERLVIFFWDEMPLMLYNIKKQNGEDSAMEILDALRSLRQMHTNLRMGFTGSIGLHNVITSLKRAGYANDPTNDMATVDVPPLLFDDAKELARRLLEGEKIPADNMETTTSAIADAVDCMPHYIHHIVDQIAQRGFTANKATVGEIVDSCLTDSQDPWHLRYYRERIDIYYEPDERRFGLNLLDVLSVSDQARLFDELFNLLKARLVTEDRETAHHVLTLLQRDHYIGQQKSGAFGFRSQLIKRWWRLHRGIG
jgi:hypothetical protein